MQPIEADSQEPRIRVRNAIVRQLHQRADKAVLEARCHLQAEKEFQRDGDRIAAGGGMNNSVSSGYQLVYTAVSVPGTRTSYPRYSYLRYWTGTCTQLL
eukprot:SAG31_NODE_368_length_16798_cov_20.422780_8_plen_99_part_00